MKVKTDFSLTWILVALPLAVLAYLSINRTYTEYQLTQKELIGADYHSKIYITLLTAQKLRGQSYLNAFTQEKTAEIAYLSQQLQQYISDIDSNNSTSQALKLQTQWAEVKTQLNSSFLQPSTLTPEHLFTEQSKVTTLLEELLTQVSRNSNLILDQEIKSYVTINVMLNTIPRLTSSLGYLRGKVSGLSATPHVSLSESERVDLVIGIANLEHLYKTYQIQAAPEKQQEKNAAYLESIRLIKEVVSGKEIKNRHLLFKDISNVIETLHHDYRSHLQHLNSLLNQQINFLIAYMAGLFAMVVAAALSFIWFTQTSIKNHRKQLEASEQFRQLIKNQSVATFSIDMNHRVVHWNHACETLTGVKAKDIVGTQDAWRGFYLNNRPCLADLVLDNNENLAKKYYDFDNASELMEHGWHAKSWFDNLGGKKRYVIFDAVPIKDTSGKTVAVVETLQDVTTAKQTEIELQTAAQKELESVKQVQTLLDNVAHGLLVLNSQGIIETANPSANQMFGYESSQLIGQPFTMLMPKKDHDKFQNHLSHYSTTGKNSNTGINYDALGLRKNGNIFNISLTVNEAVMDGIQKFICTTSDVSDRRYMDKLYRLMSENVEGYATLILDPKGNIKTWNKGAEKLKGYTADEIIGKSFQTFYTSEDIADDLPARLLATCLKEGHIHDEGWRVRKDGSQFYAEVVLNRLENDDGSTLGFVKVTRDMTKRKKLDNELKQAYSNLEEFTAVASHDLKSPISGIGDLIEWVREDLGEDVIDTVKNNLDRVQLRVKRMESLIEDLLQYSRAGKVSAEVSLTDPIKLVHDVIELQPVPPDFEINVTGKASAFKTAKTPLQTSIRNLISNAIKHHDKTDGYIEINVKIVGSYCVFEIIDDGPGIPKAAQERVFKLFQSLSNNKEASGIGLAVSKRMVETHGGYIELESSKETRGTIFRVWWPRFLTETL